MLLLVDNYDSFTYNLLDYFEQLNAKVTVVRNDAEDSVLFNPDYTGVILSPGPGTPEKANKLMAVVRYYSAQKIPLIGICLGHQAIGIHFGAQLIQTRPMHGKVSRISCVENYLYAGFQPIIDVVRYHSLVLDKLPENLTATAFTDKKEIMSLVHNSLPICGIQFHPEAWLTKDGIKILQNWLTFNKLVN